MNATEQNSLIEMPNLDTSNLAIDSDPSPPVDFESACNWALSSLLRLHWPEYLMEAACSARSWCRLAFSARSTEFPQSPVNQAIPSISCDGLLGGISMGITAIAIIYSPWGKQSGAHINPIGDAHVFPAWQDRVLGRSFLYDIAICRGGFRSAFRRPASRREQSRPGRSIRGHDTGPRGPWVALVAEYVIGDGNDVGRSLFLESSSPGGYTGLVAGMLVATYITLEAPFSGMSMNPARTFGSAFPSGIWARLWVYLTAPPLGMLTASELYLWRKGRQAVKCCKLHHDNNKRCIFCGLNGGFAS